MAEHRRPSFATGRIGLVVGAILLLVLGSAYLIAVLAHGTGVRPGTTVAGIPVGGMSVDDAVARLEETVGTRVREPIVVRAGDQEFTVDPATSGIAFDGQATVAPLAGGTWNPVTVVADLLGHLAVEPIITVDEAKLSSQVDAIAASVDVPPVEPTVTVTREGVDVQDGTDGKVLDKQALVSSLRTGLLAERSPMEASIVTAAPSITAEEIKRAKALARQATAHPVRVNASGTKAKIPAAAIADALSFTAQDGALVPVLDGAILHESIAGRLADLEKGGRDASFDIQDGKPVVVPSIVGRGVSDDELATQVATVLDKPKGQRKVSVAIGTREPRISTAQAEQLGITEQLSSFTQNFPYAAYRVKNIGQAARYVNGTILMPGETFSMNDTIKERTEKNGYTKGFVIGPGGVFAEELGGGVSSATTAVWTAAFFAGMERVFTQAHSIYISRYKPGLEATVGWGMFDMKFKNNTPNAVFITTKMTNTSMTVTFWGTKEYDDIKAVFGPKRNVTPFVKIIDTSKKCLGQDGVDGFDIDVDRVFYKGGAEVKRETITTKYRPAPHVVCKKKKGDGGQNADTPSPGATPAPTAPVVPTPSPTVPGEAPPNPGQG